MAERVILDPSEVATGRTEFDITPWVREVDWGDGDVEGYRSSGLYGDNVIDFRVPNRVVNIPLVVTARGGTAFSTVRSMLQQKAALYQREGGWVKRVTSAGTFFADVQLSGLKFSGGWLQANKDADVDATLSLECSPDFYGAESQLSDHVETAATEIRFTETSIGGNFPARVRLVVDEDQGQSQMGLFWCIRSRNYSSAATAALAYEAEALQPLDTATKVSLAGASGGTVVTHGTLSTNWTPVLNLNLGGTAYLTHTGTYRLMCRYRTTSGTAVSLRSVYDVGDLVFPTENDPWYHPASTTGTAFYIADLGELNLQQAPVGTHRWAGQIQGRGAVGSENVSLDRIWFQDVTESAGLLRAPVVTDPGLSAYVDRDEFNQTAGALTGKTSAGGKVWAWAGDASIDWQVSSGAAVRTVTTGDPDADLNTGRYAVSGAAALTTQAVQVDLWRDLAVSGDVRFGPLARYTDTNNWLLGHILIDDTTTDDAFLCVTKRVAGAVTELDRVLIAENATGAGATFMGSSSEAFRYRMRLYVDATGSWWLWWGLRSAATLELKLFGTDSTLATGGALASGKPGFYNAKNSGSSNVFSVDNFAAWVPTPDAVVNASQSIELRTDGMFREDLSGSAYGPVSWVENDLPRLPVSGIEARTVEVMVKASRGDLDTLPDTGIDDISARVTYRPCWLQVPGT